MTNESNNQESLTSQIAADYVLGTLSSTEAAVISARLNTDANLRAEVQRWESILSSLNSSSGELTTATDQWPAIQQRLGWNTPVNKRAGLLQNFVFWRGLALASLMLLTLTWGGSFFNRGPTFEPNYNTVLTGANGVNDWLVRVDTKRNLMELIALREMHFPDGMTPQLWRINEQGIPVSLGMPARKSRSMLQFNAAVFKPKGEMAMSMEPMDDPEPNAPYEPLTCKGGIKRI